MAPYVSNGAPFSNMAAAEASKVVTCSNMAARHGGHLHPRKRLFSVWRARRPPGFRRSALGSSSRKRIQPAVQKDRLCLEHVTWGRRSVIGLGAVTSDAAAARAEGREIETLRRSVRPGRSLMRSRKVRGRAPPGEPTRGGRLPRPRLAVVPSRGALVSPSSAPGSGRPRSLHPIPPRPWRRRPASPA